MVIRGLSTDELKDLGVAKVILREATAGALLGLGLGLITVVWAYFLPQSQRNLTVAITVGISLMVISILASIAGSSLPFLFKFLKLDPALMSGPFISTAVDVVGVLIYFSIAQYMLGI